MAGFPLSTPTNKGEVAQNFEQSVQGPSGTGYTPPLTYSGGGSFGPPSPPQSTPHPVQSTPFNQAQVSQSFSGPSQAQLFTESQAANAGSSSAITSEAAALRPTTASIGNYNAASVINQPNGFGTPYHAMTYSPLLDNSAFTSATGYSNLTYTTTLSAPVNNVTIPNKNSTSGSFTSSTSNKTNPIKSFLSSEAPPDLMDISGINNAFRIPSSYQLSHANLHSPAAERNTAIKKFNNLVNKYQNQSDTLNQSETQLNRWNSLIQNNTFTGSTAQYNQYVKDFNSYQNAFKNANQTYAQIQNQNQTINNLTAQQSTAKGTALDIGQNLINALYPKTEGGQLKKAAIVGGTVATAAVGLPEIIGVELATNPAIISANSGVTGENIQQAAFNSKLTPAQRIEAGGMATLGLTDLFPLVKTQRAITKTTNLQNAKIKFIAVTRPTETGTLTGVESYLVSPKGKTLASASSLEASGLNSLSGGVGTMEIPKFKRGSSRVSLNVQGGYSSELGTARKIKSQPSSLSPNMLDTLNINVPTGEEGQGILATGFGKELNAQLKSTSVQAGTGNIIRQVKPSEISPGLKKQTIAGALSEPLPYAFEKDLGNFVYSEGGTLRSFRGGPAKLRVSRTGAKFVAPQTIEGTIANLNAPELKPINLKTTSQPKTIKNFFDLPETSRMLREFNPKPVKYSKATGYERELPSYVGGGQSLYAPNEVFPLKGVKVNPAEAGLAENLGTASALKQVATHQAGYNEFINAELGKIMPKASGSTFVNIRGFETGKFNPKTLSMAKVKTLNLSKATESPAFRYLEGSVVRSAQQTSQITRQATQAAQESRLKQKQRNSFNFNNLLPQLRANANLKTNLPANLRFGTRGKGRAGGVRNSLIYAPDFTSKVLGLRLKAGTTNAQLKRLASSPLGGLSTRGLLR